MNRFASRLLALAGLLTVEVGLATGLFVVAFAVFFYLVRVVFVHHSMALDTWASDAVDGWQQAWIVPAGSGGRVVLTFSPGRTFHLALLIGLVLALLLVVLALLPSRRRPAVEPPFDRRLPVGLRVAAALLLTASLGGAVGAVCYLSFGGVLIAARRSGRQESVHDGVGTLAGAALVAAGLLTAHSPWNGTRAPAAFGTPVQVLALVALGAAAAVLSVPRWSSDASVPAPGAPPVAG